MRAFAGLPAWWPALILAIGMRVVLGTAAAGEVPILFVQTPATGQGGGSRIVLMRPEGGTAVLTEGFAEAADPCVSFDAKRVLFAGKRAETDPWEIWEMDVDGSRKVQLTSNLGDCREPIYLPRAAVDSPNFQDRVRWITFVSTAPGVWNDLGDGALTSLYAMSLEPVPGHGTVLWRTTYNLGGDVSPTLLRSDGRVLFSARQRGAYALMTISWAGENLNPFYGSHDGPVSQVSACELPDRAVVFVETEGDLGDRGGRLAQVSLRRPLHSYRVLARDGRYRTPHALPDGGLLVSWSDGHGPYAVYRFDRGRGRRTQKMYGDPAWNAVDAMPVAPVPEPPGRIPTVGFASVLDVGGLRTLGQLQCLNVYDSDRPGMAHVKPGEVTQVRLVEGVPRKASGTPSPRAAAPDSTWPPPGVGLHALGVAPVEADGSFYVNVAGDVPFFIQLLNAQGRVVETMRAWTWVRSGDQRGCIGCHEDKELAPENRATQALIRARPRTLTGVSDRSASGGD